jgi:ferritin-like protein
MAGASESYHEPYELISKEARELHRALVSCQEELEAIDWYRQRSDACEDSALSEILLHNMEEEVEHFAMALEWLRRNSSHFDQQLRTYLFAEGNILEAEEDAMGRNGDDSGGSEASIGDMKE